MSFTCPVCGAVSAHPTDALEGYCGACHSHMAPAGYEWGCEQCAFATLAERQAFAHARARDHSLTLRVLDSRIGRGAGAHPPMRVSRLPNRRPACREDAE